MKLTQHFGAIAATLLLAATAHAQTSANSAAIGKAVSGNNQTAAGVSGTGLRTDGTAETGSKQNAAGREAAGVNSKGQVTSKSTAVIGVAPGKEDSVNAQATNTTAPNSTEKKPAATGGRGKAGTKAEKEVMKANARSVKEVPGDRMKTETAADASVKKHAESKGKGAAKAAQPSTGS